ncbi:hypothetical protein [Streptomyces sp. H39-S7]|uniref:hypothetical protein n=1 Tax=Streptomyces sp. H39-S7 TaxID=3004357 RepID=UPI0022AE9D2A|nr:hypothetical protein [Streptomyces sp. H39-S7]MCZ4119195.1 hypothetical protein [Streptomyces sp. H39-S7]
MSQQSPMRGFILPIKRRVRWTLSVGTSPAADGGVVTDYLETARAAFRDALASHLSSVENADERRALTERHTPPVAEWLSRAFEADDADTYAAPGVSVSVH